MIDVRMYELFLFSTGTELLGAGKFFILIKAPRP